MCLPSASSSQPAFGAPIIAQNGTIAENTMEALLILVALLSVCSLGLYSW